MSPLLTINLKYFVKTNGTPIGYNAEGYFSLK